MTHDEKLARLKAMLKKVTPGEDLEGVVKKIPAPGKLGQEAAEASSTARSGLDKLAKNQDTKVSPDELRGMEAIILPRLRPVAFVRNNAFDPLTHELWAHLNKDPIKARLNDLLPSVGRIELAGSSLPYGGTGFLVGPNLVMTNRHVARLFVEGVGMRRLVYRSGDAAVDFKKEKDTPVDDRTALVQVRKVVMVHPYWDMALLEVEGLPAAHKPLRLSVRAPEELRDQEVVAVGYPALDPRNDLGVQNQVFGGVYEVKRFQPGLTRVRRRARSFGNDVNALTHDSSTLGGNSGSAVIHIESGQVVGLHFSGLYLDANFAVPAYELARDARVVQAGVNFAGTVPPATGEWNWAWLQTEGEEGKPAPGPVQSAVQAGNLTATWTIPIQVSVTLGQPALAGAPPAGPAAVAGVEARPMQVPKIYPNLKARSGYQPDFLDGMNVPLPKLTTKGEKMAAEVDDGEYELKYHHFSVVMHKKRRLALFTAANVDWRPDSRQVDGEVPTRRELTEIPDGVAEEWMTDRRISLEHQLPDVFFTKDRAAWDKGHLIRRDDVCWGDSELSGDRKFKDIQKANGDTYHTTNCSPQVAGFNRPAADDNWGDLEKMVQQETKSEKVIVFSGPVLADDDREFQGRDLNGEVWIPIPSRFWKIVVAAGEGGPKAYGFVLEQDTSDVRWEELAIPSTWQQYMKPIADIEKLLFGLAELKWLKDHDGSESEEGVRIAAKARRSVR
ncbi:MAG TPA: DNA/RNA non-specific endonuclease [Gemmataceae bacterium]|nr:DNA/RNA non-specific endonuclease [Gemmataceae bacterium]